MKNPVVPINTLTYFCLSVFITLKIAFQNPGDIINSNRLNGKLEIFMNTGKNIYHIVPAGLFFRNPELLVYN